MQKTETYQLPQWEANDPIQRTDFNEAFAAVEEAFLAQSEATEDVKEIAEAAYCPTQKPYVTGYYQGTGTGSQTINVGFKPSFLIISNGYGLAPYNFPAQWMGTEALAGSTVAFAANGFTVTWVDEASSGVAHVNQNRRYGYIAFR